MEEIICYTSYLPEGAKQNIPFLELLLDERWADGRIEYPKHIHAEIGDINHKLAAKQSYEFLLRAAQHYPVTLVGGAITDPSAAGVYSGQSDSDWVRS